MVYIVVIFTFASWRPNCVATFQHPGYIPIGASTDVELNWCIWHKIHFYETTLRPRVKLPLPWFYNKPWLKLGSANSLDMKNQLKVKLGLDQVSTKTRQENWNKLSFNLDQVLLKTRSRPDMNNWPSAYMIQCCCRILFAEEKNSLKSLKYKSSRWNLKIQDWKLSPSQRSVYDSFLYNGLRLWNTLPDPLKVLPELRSFKCSFKRFLKTEWTLIQWLRLNNVFY